MHGWSADEKVHGVNIDDDSVYDFTSLLLSRGDGLGRNGLGLQIVDIEKSGFDVFWRRRTGQSRHLLLYTIIERVRTNRGMYTHLTFHILFLFDNLWSSTYEKECFQ